MAVVRNILGAALLVLAVLPAAGQNYLHQRVTATILVADPDLAADRLEGWVERSGGYVLLKSSDRVVFRVPFERTSRLEEILERLADEVVTISPQSLDLREQILQAEAGINSRREVLARTLALLSAADTAGTLAIEKEILALVEEIERLEGTLQKLNLDRAFSLVEVALNTLRQSLPESIPSSFEWINGVDFYEFIRGNSLSGAGGR